MSFETLPFPPVGKDVFRLGLALNYGIKAQELRPALERGINYVFWTRTQRAMIPELRAALKADREGLILATGPSLGFIGAMITRAAEAILKELDTDYIDVFHLFWLGKGSAFTDGTLEALNHLKTSGKVRALAVSIHDRPRAGLLAADSPLDVLMVRYNAAHPGAEEDIFPHLAPEKRIVAYTATSWRRLLKAPSGWEEPVPTAGDCYRFCLTHPAVSLALCGPGSLAQLDENIAALARGPMEGEELAWMRRFGRRVHGGLMRDAL